MTPNEHSAARLIACERTGRWAVALRRELAGAGVYVHETRSPADCWEMLAAAPASFLVVELIRPAAEGLLRRLARLQREYPAARVAVVADRALGAYEWLMREAGAVHFTCSPRRLASLAALACRHLAQVPAPPQSLAERIWSGLPWKAVGSGEWVVESG